MGLHPGAERPGELTAPSRRGRRATGPTAEAAEAEAELRLDELQQRLRVSFRNRDLLREAMTHASWNNERGEHGKDNERLEYLGDAVLELVTGEYLFKRFPTYDEGQLTQMRSSLVNTQALAKLGAQLQLGESLRLGRGAAKTGARRLTSLLANAFEAMIGAIFLDQGYRVAGRIFLSRIGDVSDWTDTNFKGRLQALAQERFGTAPQYRVTAVTGPGHAREYLAQAVTPTDPDRVLGEGRGGTKQAAEQTAARNAIDQITAPVSRPRRARRARGLVAVQAELPVAEPLAPIGPEPVGTTTSEGADGGPSPTPSRRGHRGGRRRSGRVEAGGPAGTEATTPVDVPVSAAGAAGAPPPALRGETELPSSEGWAVTTAQDPQWAALAVPGPAGTEGESAAPAARTGARRRGRRGGRAREAGAAEPVGGAGGDAAASAPDPQEAAASDTGPAAGDVGAGPARSGTHRRGRRGSRTRRDSPEA